MTKLLINPRFFDHPRTLKAGNAAAGLWVRAGCWLAQYPAQDDVIPDAMVLRIGSRNDASELVKAGLWVRIKGGYRMLRCVSPFNWMPVNPEPLWTAMRDDYRRKIAPEVRQLVMERDGNRCVECGSQEDLSLDHIHPWSLGGQDTEDNLRVLCRPCNSSKGARV